VEVIRMDAKAEKIALFRYGLIAPLVLEALPRGELTHRAEEIAARQYEIPGSSALHAVGDSYLLLTRPSPQFNTVELRFQFRYAAPQPPRLLELDPSALWFSPAGAPPVVMSAARRKVGSADVRQALTELGAQARYNQLRQQIMTLTCKHKITKRRRTQSHFQTPRKNPI
jgi:hypothetical protein